MEFVEKRTHTIIRRKLTKCLVHWVWTIQSAKYLWSELYKSKFSSFNLKYINQDIVENIFSKIRDNGHRNNNPSPLQFSGAFKTIVTTNFTSKHSISSNCEESKEGMSLSLLKICHNTLKESETEQNDNIECTEAAISDAINKHMFVDAQKIIAILEKEKSITECEECFKIIKYNSISDSVQHALDIGELQFPQFCHEIEVKEKLKKILSTEIFSKVIIHCPSVRNIIIDVTAQQFILQWCKFINNILTGKIDVESDTNFMYNEARRIYLNRSKKKK